MTTKKTIKRICGGLVALALGAVITLKDNVHLGSVTLPENSKGNQYALGIFPKITASGTNIVGNHYSIGLLVGINDYSTNSVHNGNSTSIGLFYGDNFYSTNSVHNGNSNSRGLVCIDEEGMHFLGNKIIKVQEKK